MRGKRLTQEYVEQVFKDHGCILLDTYTGAAKRMNAICSCKRSAQMRYSDVRRGIKCKKCGIEAISYSFSEVKEFFEQNNCILWSISSDYKNGKTLLDYTCSCGERGKIRFYRFIYGCRCSKCGITRRTEKTRTPFEEIKREIEEGGNYSLTSSSDKYENNNSSFEIHCNHCGKRYHKTLASFRGWKGCTHKIDGRSNSDRIEDKCYNWIEDRDEKRLNDKFRQKCRGILKRSLRSLGIIKTNKTYDLLGYTNEDIKKYIENHPNWGNINKESYHIDHIFPIKAFVDHQIYDIKLINSLDNLQPLNGDDNLRKHHIYNPEEFKIWLLKHDIII